MNKSFETLSHEIRTNVIPSIFPSLNSKHRQLIEKYITRLILIIPLFFGISDSTQEMYFYQLKQNNYQDIRWLISHLLPFLNSSNDLSLITSFNDIYVKKKKVSDLNTESPDYLYSNIQYNRFDRSDVYIEKEFNENDFDQNYYLLVDTIRNASNKLHVNWIDILPYTLQDYKSSMLYVDTFEKIAKHTLAIWDPIIHSSLNAKLEDIENSELTYGLYIGDIYNTISIDLYESIKYIKWAIYNIPTTDKIFPSIILLHNYFDLRYCLAGFTWESLTNDFKKDFNEKWNYIVSNTIKGNDIYMGTISVSNESLKMLLRGIILSFDKRSEFMEEAVDDGYIEIEDNIYDDDDEVINTKRGKKLLFHMIEKNILSLNSKFVYEFFRISLDQLKNTWYGFQLLNTEKTNINTTFDYYFMGDSNIPLLLKDVYNFSKSLTHYEVNGEYIQYPNHWRSLSDAQKTEILKRLNCEYDNPIEWFNISGYIQFLKIKDKTPLETIKDINIQIHNNVMKKLTNILFESLITKGVLTKFVPNKNKTDQRITNRDDLKSDLLNPIETNKYWTSAYHFLTMVPYNKMPKYMSSDGITVNYFTNDTRWYKIYSYDWIAQIGFCHHFLNNRVIFITGATGVGKSTEVPKLFLYYTKTLEYINNPRIVCTQPRKAPTEGNATYTSYALGVPIFSGKSKTRTNNYYVQMKHRDFDHTKNVNNPVMKYITDGSLILELNDPILKTKSHKKYTSRNIYDVVMIDEAHEHKINMDMLLSLLKIPIAYNNSIKLVILSATMDEDEPKYRRYYRDINDNRKYPFDTWISKHAIDRINIDRRYHISPPNYGTNYKVDEIYVPNGNEFETIMNILKSSPDGDILVFQSGTNEINELVSQLNKNTPNEVIALPYHSRLSNYVRNSIEHIDVELKKIGISKFADVTRLESLEGNNKYTRAIIVATNIAEASITIPSLRFVVETGNQKTSVYDYKKRGEKLIKMDISESSRIQRKGRVGRKAIGTVYYMYEKGKMENNKIAYEIALMDLYLILFQKLRSKSNEQIFIDELHDPNSPIVKLTVDEVKKKFNKNDLHEIILNQYFNGTNYYDYYGDDKIYDYKNYSTVHPYYETGFSAHSLIDKYGTFYLIHPNELDIIRNINGDIVEIKNYSEVSFSHSTSKNKLAIISKKMRSFWKILLDYLYVTFSRDRKDITKTELGTIIIKLFEDFQIDNHNMLRSLIFGMMLDCSEEMLRLSIIYQITNFDPLKICSTFITSTNLNEQPDYEYTKKLFKETTSDSHILLSLLSDFHNFLESLNISNNPCDSMYIENMAKNVDGSILKKKYDDILRNDNDESMKQMIGKLLFVNKSQKFNFDLADYMQLMGPEIHYSSDLQKKIIKDNRKEIMKYIHENLENVLFVKLKQNQSKIIEWCNKRHLNYNILKSYISNYITTKVRVLSKITKVLSNKLETLGPLFKQFISEHKHNKIDMALLFGFPLNTLIKMNNSKYYLSVYNPMLTNASQISSLSQYKFRPSTFINNIFLEEYLLYLNINIENDSVSCLHYIKPELIVSLAHIYTKSHFEKMCIDEKEIIDAITNKKNKYDSFKNKNIIGSNFANSIIQYNNTIQKMTNNCIQLINDSLKQFIMSLDKEFTIEHFNELEKV